MLYQFLFVKFSTNNCLNNLVRWHTVKYKYRLITLSIIIIICSVVSFFYVISTNSIGDIYKVQTQESITDLKKSFLKDTVNNIITEIDYMKKSETTDFEKIVKNTSTYFDKNREVEPKIFSNIFIEYFQNEKPLDYWTVVLWDTETNKAIYDPQSIITGRGVTLDIESIKHELTTYHTDSYGKYKALFGIKTSYINDLVKHSIAQKIHSSKFDQDSYIWVNEIVNYNGGTNYAIRKIHPSLPSTEGIHLSTDMKDVKGNFPYLEELEGVKKSGEIFFTYYFKKMNSTSISEKLTYAKLYKDFNWVISMGVHLDDIQIYIDKTNEKSKALASKLTIFLLFVLLVILALSISLLALLEKFVFSHSIRLLEKEVNQDMLTKAYSRRFGTKDMIKAFNHYKKNEVNPAIMIFDIDHFKNINDAFGHDIGDETLIKVSHTIQNIIRSTDKLIRWGGDEFVIIFNDLKEETALLIAEKILSEVALLSVCVRDTCISPTLSIGATYFKESDHTYTDAIKRADIALYKSKSKGRNQVNIEL
jgi:diguanylate cyclase (GGDEF)-like protein